MSFYVRPRSSFIRWASSVLLIGTVILVILQLIVYSRDRANFPAGLVIAGVPVGGVSRQAAAERLLEIYNLPVELQYGDALIHLDPARVDFNLNLESMIAAADLQRTGSSFWGGFWDYLWGYSSSPQEVPLDATYSEALLRSYLQGDIAARYDKPPAPAQPIAGTTQFALGEPGTTIDVDNAVGDIEKALFSPTERVVQLNIDQVATARPNLQNLQVQLQQIIDGAAYDGIADVYFQDLVSGQEMHFIYQLGSNLPTDPDLAFTAASVIKIPILVSVYQHLNSQPNGNVQNLLTEMIAKSDNTATDAVMQTVIDLNSGPLKVTEDMQRLGFKSTFLAGYFQLGSPLLVDFRTSAPQRNDVSTDPDPYNELTPVEIGMLLSDLYQCAETGGGALVAVFGDQITQPECQDMLNLLSQDNIGVLLQAGIPEGTRIAHKHGWAIDSITKVINTMGDAGIVFTPSGDYVAVIFMYQPVQLIFDPASALFAKLSEAIYNYYTLPQQGS
jgi:beta-lactamase class A